MTGIEMIAEKVRTNRENKGYTKEHDLTHDKGELIVAAECYLARAGLQVHLGNIDYGPEGPNYMPEAWPFERASWKPSDDPIRNLVHAGALIAAEIDRLSNGRI